MVLDVGCNEGRVTCEIGARSAGFFLFVLFCLGRRLIQRTSTRVIASAQLRRARKVMGVDIDETLISAAWRRRRTVWSLQEPLSLLPPSSSDASSVPPPRAEEASLSAELSPPPPPQPPQPRKRRRAGSSSEAEIETSGETLTANTNPVANYFPASCEHEFGSLPIPPYQTHEGGKDVFPHNVVFRTVDWVADDVVEDGDGYDVVLAYVVGFLFFPFLSYGGLVGGAICFLIA